MRLSSTMLVCLVAGSLCVVGESRADLLDEATKLLADAKKVKNAKARQKLTERAQSALERFLKQSTDKRKRADAASPLADILLGKARALSGQSRLAKDGDRKTQLQKQARQLVLEARRLYQEAHDQYKREYDAFPKFIDPSEQHDFYEARERAAVHYIRVQLMLAQSLYEEAMTYDTGTAEAKELLGKAASEFADIHERYRSQVGGLYASLWQGRCFDELGDVRKALGIYNALLDNPGRSPVMRRLKDQARLYRLICLNSDQRKDYLLVIDEATQWLKDASEPESRVAGVKVVDKMAARADSEMGLGVRWQMARAQFLHANGPDTEPRDRELMLRDALSNARHITKFPGRYQAAAKAMVTRLTQSGSSSDQPAP